MAYERVTDLSCDTVVKLGGVDDKTKKANPTELEGYYLGFRTVTTTNGESKIHVFQTPSGNLGTWGSKDLNDKLQQVKPGAMSLVNFTGKKKLQGGKTLNTFSVQQDKENVLDVSGFSAASESYQDSEVDNNSDDDTVDDDAEQTAALIAAERAAKAAKVQEILNRGKVKKA